MKVALLIASFLWAFPVSAQTGHWEGIMVRDGSELHAIFDFEQAGTNWKGFFNAPSMRALQVPLSNVRLKDQHVHFELVGDETTTVFEGNVDGDSMAGTFQEGEAHGTFELKRVPSRRHAFVEESVTFKNGNINLAGTLLLPRKSGKNPAVVFQHGSGPEGRFGGRFLAEQCAEHGIAALIYDKRGVGESTGDWKQATFQDLAQDAVSGIHFLGTRNEIEARQIGIYGHSQGGYIGPLIASFSNDVAFVISADSSGGPVYEQDLFRVKNSLEQSGFTKQEQDQAFRRSW